LCQFFDRFSILVVAERHKFIFKEERIKETAVIALYIKTRLMLYKCTKDLVAVVARVGCNKLLRVAVGRIEIEWQKLTFERP
jgi:hypothetical protein